MAKLLNLITDELKRAKIFYLLLIAFVLISEGIMVFVHIRASYAVSTASENIDNISLITNLNGVFDNSMVYTMIIGATAFALLGYSVFSWIRDWHFQGNFIYRLLTLPGNRAPIAFAKLISTLIMMAGILILQLGLFYIANSAFRVMFNEQYTQVPVLIQLATTMEISSLLFPPYPTQTFMIYGGGLWFLFTLMNSLIMLLSAKGYTWFRTVATTMIYWIVSLALIYLLAWLTIILPLTNMEATVLVLVYIYAINIINGYMMSWLMNHYVSV
ncbi:hypothetical protein CJ191_00255 [Aerococcus viridans]|uniref:ABC-2 family transporter protein n=1 Tax=Aerococcus viridans TaxID=1377 RepID=A0A2N6UG38_9LACT|nr:hypothetical protein [Aerococcus viridans]PMC80589.1 hypothetical protein CJ191_00255 [Aerococcus viridans]